MMRMRSSIFSDLRERFSRSSLEARIRCICSYRWIAISYTEETKPKLIKFLKRKLDPVGKVKEDSIFMPLWTPMATSEEVGTATHIHIHVVLIDVDFAFAVEFSTAAEALAACKQLDMVPLDKKHTLRVNKLTDIERFGREGRIDENYTPPSLIPAFEEKEHLRSWLADPGSGRGRDQFVMCTRTTGFRYSGTTRRTRPSPLLIANTGRKHLFNGLPKAHI